MRNVVVTGGTRGIGLGIARELAHRGYHVVAIARTRPQLELDRFSFLSWDLSAAGSLHELASTLRQRFGPVYGLVNNAGIGTHGILSTMPESQIEQLVRMNVTAPITLTKYLIRPMMTARAGRVVNIASVVAATGYSGLSVYGATKAALVGFTRSLAREVGPLGITVNAVSPGFIDTEMTHGLTDQQRYKIASRSALQRLTRIEDVVAAVAFLMSEDAANITGTVVTVDAGNTA